MLIARYSDALGVHLGVVEGSTVRPIDTFHAFQLHLPADFHPRQGGIDLGIGERLVRCEVGVVKALEVVAVMRLPFKQA